jgi:hypothetical protein
VSAVDEKPLIAGRVPSKRVAAPSRHKLDRYIEQALRRRFGSGGNLRHAVRRVVLEMVTEGASEEAIRTLLTRSVENHPQRHRWDRVSIVTGLTASSVLISQMLQWAEQPTSSRRGGRQESSPERRGAHVRARVREGAQ